MNSREPSRMSRLKVTQYNFRNKFNTVNRKEPITYTVVRGHW